MDSVAVNRCRTTGSLQDRKILAVHHPDHITWLRQMGGARVPHFHSTAPRFQEWPEHAVSPGEYETSDVEGQTMNASLRRKTKNGSRQGTLGKPGDRFTVSQATVVGPGRYEEVRDGKVVHDPRRSNSSFKSSRPRLEPVPAEKVEAPFLVHDAQIKGTEEYRSKTNAPRARQLSFGASRERWAPPKLRTHPAPGDYEPQVPARRVAGGARSTSEKMPDPPRSMDASDGRIGPGHYYDHSCSLFRKTFNRSHEGFALRTLAEHKALRSKASMTGRPSTSAV